MTETVKKDFEFVRGNLMLLPYEPTFGVYKEDALISIYNRLKTEGLFDIVFHESTNMTLLQFMNFFSDPSKSLSQIFSLVDGDKIVDIVGMAWVTDIAVCAGKLTRAVGSFVFFKDYQKPAYTDQFAWMVIDYWFNVLGIDTIVGVTPEENRAALIYVKRAGFKEVGRLPNYTTYKGEVTAGVVTLMTRDQFQHPE